MHSEVHVWESKFSSMDNESIIVPAITCDVVLFLHIANCHDVCDGFLCEPSTGLVSSHGALPVGLELLALANILKHLWIAAQILCRLTV